MRETGQLRSILKVSAVVKQDNFTAMRNGGDTSQALAELDEAIALARSAVDEMLRRS